jgi:hypothetical protein
MHDERGKWILCHASSCIAPPCTHVVGQMSPGYVAYCCHCYPATHPTIPVEVHSIHKGLPSLSTNPKSRRGVIAWHITLVVKSCEYLITQSATSLVMCTLSWCNVCRLSFIVQFCSIWRMVLIGLVLLRLHDFSLSAASGWLRVLFLLSLTGQDCVFL